MTTEKTIPLKGAVVNLLLAAVWTAAAYVVFVGGVCVWVGISDFHRQGSWVPILVGCLTIGIVLWSAFPIAGALRASLKSKTVESDNGLC